MKAALLLLVLGGHCSVKQVVVMETPCGPRTFETTNEGRTWFRVIRDNCRLSGKRFESQTQQQVRELGLNLVPTVTNKNSLWNLTCNRTFDNNGLVGWFVWPRDKSQIAWKVRTYTVVHQKIASDLGIRKVSTRIQEPTIPRSTTPRYSPPEDLSTNSLKSKIQKNTSDIEELTRDVKSLSSRISKNTQALEMLLDKQSNTNEGIRQDITELREMLQTLMELQQENGSNMSPRLDNNHKPEGKMPEIDEGTRLDLRITRFVRQK